jgi:FixJ family two-component response regulator
MMRASGALRLSSELGRGTEIEILLPAYADRQDATVERAATRASSLSGRVLVVDDSAETVQTVGRLVASLGLDVQHATSAVAACAQAEASDHPFDVLLVDLPISKQSDPELAAHLTLRGLVRAVVYMSATADDSITKDLTACVLAKPFTRAQLVDALWTALPQAAQQEARRPDDVQRR